MKKKNENTVFILGAGASVPYNFPTSRTLRKDIIDNFDKNFSSSFRIDNDYDRFQYKAILTKIKEFQNRFDLSSIYSVDFFIARNPKYSELGKNAIIIHLLEYESKCRFRESSLISNSDWYSYLYNYMIYDFRTPDSFSKISNNNFSFLTFNYDRSLEQFLTECIAYSFESITEIQLREVISCIPIIHIYGTISSIPFRKSDNGLQFGSKISYDEISKYSQNIKTICDKNEINSNVHELIEEAERIFFLGFGYDRLNLENIGIPFCLRHGQKIYGTAFGLNKRYVDDLKEYIIEKNYNQQKKRKAQSPTMLDDRDIIFEDVDCLTLLRNYL